MRSLTAPATLRRLAFSRSFSSPLKTQTPDEGNYLGVLGGGGATWRQDDRLPNDTDRYNSAGCFALNGNAQVLQKLHRGCYVGGGTAAPQQHKAKPAPNPHPAKHSRNATVVHPSGTHPPAELACVPAQLPFFP